MRRIIILFIALAIIGCSRQGDSRLSGTFVSDKAATLSYLESTGQYNTSQLEILGSLLGKLEITYSGSKTTTLLNGEKETRTFNILEAGSNHVTVEMQFGTEELLGKVMMITNRIEFISDGYWISGGMMQDPYKEKFIKKEALEE